MGELGKFGTENARQMLPCDVPVQHTRVQSSAITFAKMSLQ